MFIYSNLSQIRDEDNVTLEVNSDKLINGNSDRYRFMYEKDLFGKTFGPKIFSHKEEITRCLTYASGNNKKSSFADFLDLSTESEFLQDINIFGQQR